MSLTALKKQAEAIRDLILTGGNIYEETYKCSIQRNAITKRHFGNLRNAMSLQLVAWKNGWVQSQWISFSGIKERDLKLKEGSKPSWVIGWFPKKNKKDEVDENEDKKPSFYPKAYRVFNIEQLEDYSMFIDDSGVAEEDNLYDDLHDMVASLGVTMDKSVEGYCYYRPGNDTVYMLDKSEFTSSNASCSVLLHEAVHSTGHKLRLNRKFSFDQKSKDYAREEGIADMAAFCLACHFGCSMSPGHHAAYVASWIKDDHSFLDEIIKEAMTAVSFILNHKMSDEDTDTSSVLQNAASVG